MPNGLNAYVPQSARDLIEAYSGAYIGLRPQESVASVGTTALKVGTFARQRVAVLMCNNGSAAVYLGFSPTVSTTQGIQLAVGQSVSFAWWTDGELVMQDMWMISGSPAQSVYCLESVLTGNS